MADKATLEYKQHQLYALVATYEHLRTFTRELRRVTRNKRFRVTNELAWDAVLSLRRTLVIDLAAWVKTLHAGWLRGHLSQGVLAGLRASKRDATKRAENSWIEAPPEDRGPLRRGLAANILESRRSALRRTFGAAVAHRGGATGDDVLRLEKKLEAWADSLHQARHTQAHPYGVEGTAAFLSARRLEGYLAKCGRLMNDLRLLVQDSTMSMPLRSKRSDPMTEDLVDMVVLGTIEFSRAEIAKMPGRWFGEKREAYYAALHARRRKKRTDPFNDPI